MRYKTSKVLFPAAVFFLLSFCILSQLSSANPYLDKKHVTSAASDIIAAILDEDADTLMELSELPGAFEFDKKDKIKTFLKNYFNKAVETKEIKLQGVKLTSDHEGKAMVQVYQYTRKDRPYMEIYPRNETWSFVKGEKGSTRGKWRFLFDQTSVTSSAMQP